MLSAKKTGWLAICAALIAVLLVSSFPFVGVPLGSKSSGNLISTVSAQGDPCAGCDTVLDEIQLWQNRLDTLPSDASPADAVRARQALDAANNRLNWCINHGCNIGGPTATPDNGGGGGDLPVCGDGLCETDKGESCANCLSDCPCSSGEACQPSDSNADAWGCVAVVITDSDGDENGCFIATAAYGTPTAKEINILRHFRDEVLVKNAPGRTFVNLYYQFSPPVADLVSHHEFLRTLVREGGVNPIVNVVKATSGLWDEAG